MELSRDEKTIARVLFQLKVSQSDGMAFETLFTSIMNYAEPDFEQIKPWGNIGDRKNDGYIKSRGVFFQVFAPEDLRLKYTEAISKLKIDIDGLFSQWSPINEFYFVLNDKYKGVNADSEQIMNQIIAAKKLKEGGLFKAKDLEDALFSLSDDQIQVIVGHIPDPLTIRLDYSILNEVIRHIMGLSLDQSLPSDIKLPDWNKKIQFNQLSEATATRLNNGSFQINVLQEYLDNNSSFLADELRDKMSEIYHSEKKFHSGDALFWAIVEKSSPMMKLSYQSAVIIIMAKYFETCDIFEHPGDENDTSN